MLVIFWLIVIATHVELVRQHDGPITPISYVLGVVISVLAVGFLLTFSVLSARRPAESAVGQDGVNPPQREPTLNPDVGQADGTAMSPGGLGAQGARVRGTAPYRTPEPEGFTGDGRPYPVVPSGAGQPGRIPTPAEEQVLRSAKAAYAKRDFKASARTFQELVHSPVYAAEAYYGLGMVALAEGRRQEADKLFGACINADRAHANAWYQLGQLRESQSPAEASQFYQEALRLNPQHAGARRKLGAGRGTRPSQQAPGRPAYPSFPIARGAAPDTGRETGGAGQQFADAPSGHIRGRVVGFQRRAEQSFFLHRLYLYVWDFRVNRPGLAPVMVEMRGFRFRGDISNGDVVDIATRGSGPGQVLRVRRLYNLTTNAPVTTSYGRGPRTLAAAAKIAAALLVLAVMISIAVLVIHSVNG